MNESRMVLWKELYNEEQEQIAQADSIIHQNDELLKQLCENQERARALVKREKVWFFSHERETDHFYALACLGKTCAFIQKGSGICYEMASGSARILKNASIRKFARKHGARIVWLKEK